MNKKRGTKVKRKVRGINDEFIEELKNGILKPLLDWVVNDDTLDFQIRNEYINIYYRGSNLGRVSKKENAYVINTHRTYCCGMSLELKSSMNKYNIFNISDAWECMKWVSNIPVIKQNIDFYLTANPSLEREMQQIVVRENNYTKVANGTDFFIADIEYGGNIVDNGEKKKYRFDMTGVRWLSTIAERQKNTKLVPCFIEMKYGDKAVNGAAGLEKHFKDMTIFLKDADLKNTACEEIENIFTQKQKLGLLDNIAAFKDLGNDKTIKLNRNIKPYYILILSNTSYRSEQYNNALQAVETVVLGELKEVADVKIAKASYMGYGLYEKFLEEI